MIARIPKPPGSHYVGFLLLAIMGVDLVWKIKDFATSSRVIQLLRVSGLGTTAVITMFAIGAIIVGLNSGKKRIEPGAMEFSGRFPWWFDVGLVLAIMALVAGIVMRFYIPYHFPDETLIDQRGALRRLIQGTMSIAAILALRVVPTSQVKVHSWGIEVASVVRSASFNWHQIDVEFRVTQNKIYAENTRVEIVPKDGSRSWHFYPMVFGWDRNDLRQFFQQYGEVPIIVVKDIGFRSRQIIE